MKNHPTLKNRKGLISVNSSTLHSLSEKELSTLFRKFFPVQIVHKGDLLGYYGYSSKFDEIEDWEDIPEYRVTIFDDGTVDMERIVEQQIPTE